MGLNKVNLLHAVGPCNDNINYTLTIFFRIHGLIGVIVMSLEIAVFAFGFISETKILGKGHGKLVKILFPYGGFFPFRRNCLLVNVRLLGGFRGEGSKS
jgi:hypothetical protein